MNHKIGLALSGGGVRAIAQIGILKILNENGIKPTIIAGTSGGAIVGALYASGNDAQTMMDFFTQTPLFHWSKLALSKAGILSPKKFMEDFKKYVPFEKIEDLPIELSIVATDIVHGREKIFTSGNLLDAVMASAAFPGVFQPVTIDGILYSDGGIFNNMPADVIRDQCKFLIG
ncbi:MAG: family protein RssA, partial [Bacteroidota bacterium]